MHNPQYITTNCGEQTVVPYKGSTVIPSNMHPAICTTTHKQF